jgi:hypothetical protein
MSVATPLIIVKIYTADAALILIIEPPNSETAETPWDLQSSFISLTE